MSLLANVPTLSYISWKNMIITYNETTYQIENSYTNKAYIYWDFSNPYLLITSNVKLEPKNDLFYIIFNDSGTYTVVPNDGVEIDFSENPSRNAMTNRLIGLSNDTKNKFTAIQVDVDGIRFDVYDTEGKFSKFEQRADKIELEVKGVQKQYSTDAKLTEMRENFSASLLSLQSTLGLFSSDMNTYMEDNKLTTEEENEINAYKSSLEEKRVGVNTQLDTIKAYLQGLENVDTEKIIKLDTARDELNTSISNLFTNIDTVCVDDVFTNTEITAVVTYFGKVNLEINECKNTIDECIFLGIDGLLIEEISNISLKQDSIKLEVKRVENHTNAELSRIELKQDEITLEVRNEIDGLNSKITQTAEQLTTDFSNEIEGLNSKITQTAEKLTTDFTDADKNLQSQITQTAEQLTTNFTNEDKKLQSQITQTAEQLTTNFTNADKDLESKITLTAEQLTTNFTNADKDLESQITQTAEQLAVDFTNIIEGLDSKITLTAEQLTTSFTDEIEGLESQITQTAEQLTTNFTDEDKKLQSQITQNANEITSRVSALDAKMDSAEEAFFDFDTRLNTAEEKITPDAIINTVSSTYYKKSEADALYATQTQMGAAEEAFLDFNTRLNTAEQKITSDAIINTVSSTIDSKINDVSIGGRNLLLLTNTEISGTGNNTNQEINLYGLSPSKSDLGSKKVTLSFTYKVSNYTSGAFMIRACFAAYDDFGTITPTGNGTFTYTKTITTSSNFGSNDGVQLILDNFNGTVTVSKMKLEKGDKATDWTPAPEDVQSQIDTNSTIITAAENAFIDLDARMNTAESTIIQQANQIQSKVDVNGVISTVTQNAGSIISEFTETGKVIIKNGNLAIQHPNGGDMLYTEGGRLVASALDLYGENDGTLRVFGTGNKGVEIRSENDNMAYLDFSRNASSDYHFRVSCEKNESDILARFTAPQFVFQSQYGSIDYTTYFTILGHLQVTGEIYRDGTPIASYDVGETLYSMEQIQNEQDEVLLDLAVNQALTELNS